jgi:hypothetical protein
MLRPGIYSARVVKHVWTTSQNLNPGLAVTVAIFSDDGFGEEEIIGKIWFSDKAMGMARAQLRALGFDPDSQDPAEIGFSISLVGNETEVILEEQEYNGRRELKVARFGKAAPPPSKEALQALGTKLRSAKKAKPQPKPPDPSPAVAQEPARQDSPSPTLTEDIEAAKTDPPEDDIPF